ncbi:MAG: thioredoxin family protein [Bacteroidota bacterium]
MKAIFYHAGCPVCIDAEQQILQLVDTDTHEVEIVHLGDAPNRLAEAKATGVKSVPALVLEGGIPLHLNFGAAIEALEA